MHTHQRYEFSGSCFFFYATFSQATILFFACDMGVHIDSGSVNALSNPTVCFDMWQPLLNPSSSTSNLLISLLYFVLSLASILSFLFAHVLFSFILVINSKTFSPWRNSILTMFTRSSFIQCYSYFLSFGILVKKPIIQSHLLLHLFIWDEGNMYSLMYWWKNLVTEIENCLWILHTNALHIYPALIVHPHLLVWVTNERRVPAPVVISGSH